MFLAVLFCSGILTSAPGCREHGTVLRDQAANEINCVSKAQEVIVDQMRLHPDARSVRWGCRRRSGAAGGFHA